ATPADNLPEATMNGRPRLAYVMYGQKIPSAMDEVYAVVPIGEEKSAQLIELVRTIRKQNEQEGEQGFRTVSLPDKELLVFQPSWRFAKMSDPHHPRHEFYRVVMRTRKHKSCEL